MEDKIIDALKNSCRQTGKLLSSVVVSALLLQGCASMKGLAPQLNPTDAALIASNNSFASAHRDSPYKAAWPTADWWYDLGDLQLDALVAEALKDSPDLAIADARSRQASAVTDYEDANRQLHALGKASVQGVRAPESLLPAPLGGAFFSTKMIGINASYDLDLWGGKRAAWEAALGGQYAAEIDARMARLTLVANVVSTYARLGHAFHAHDLGLKNVERAKHLLALVRQRVAAGIDSMAQQREAEAAVAAAEGETEQFAHAIQIQRSALAVLLGKGPDRGLEIQRPAELKRLTLAPPDNLPAELVGRRPDIVAARWRVEAAEQGIKVAKADFYPSFNLGAAIGLISFRSSDLFSLPSRYYTITPALTLPIFSSGRRATLSGRDADYDLAVAQYNKTLVSAFNQVVSQVQEVHSLDAQAVAQQRAVDASREARDLANQRYERGIGSYVEVLTIEQSALIAEARLDNIRIQQIDGDVQLIRALGGGYQANVEQETNNTTKPAVEQGAKEKEQP